MAGGSTCRLEILALLSASLAPCSFMAASLDCSAVCASCKAFQTCLSIENHSGPEGIR